ncbi:MAG: SDR family NAD(P)-dependent oxidoreductase, partial [Woeseia sp.]
NPKTAVVTGATSGIGLACVEALLDDGHRVIALGRRAERIEQMRAQFGEERFYGAICDVRDRASIDACIAALPADMTTVDTLINNAGLLVGSSDFIRIEPDAVHTMLQTNIAGVLNTTQAFLPMLESSVRGHIVNITSIGAKYHYVGGNVYAATKAFVEHFGHCLRAELVGRKIRVSNIAPGRTETEFSLVRFGGDADKAKQAYQDVTPLQAEDIARAIVWILAQPVHVNVNSIELMPADQSFSFR